MTFGGDGQGGVKMRYNCDMKTKPLTFLSKIKSLFTFSGNEPEVKKEYRSNGKLKSEENLKNGKVDGRATNWYKSGKKKLQVYHKNGNRDPLGWPEIKRTHCL
jgi:antitoxin component YwqK of YwqJK toxin-antitoxin module